jgi:hypothetical protein
LLACAKALLFRAIVETAQERTASSCFCRWLLRARDLSGSDHLPFTQEFLAEMLGVRRTSDYRCSKELPGVPFLNPNTNMVVTAGAFALAPWRWDSVLGAIGINLPQKADVPLLNHLNSDGLLRHLR